MATPRPKDVIKLNEEQYKNLKHLSLSYTEPWVEVQRARILILAHEHANWSNRLLSDKVGCQIDMVKKCRKSWQQQPHVKSAYRAGSPRKFTALQRSQIVALACSRPSDHGKIWKRWSNDKLAKVAIEKK